jgi:hypothetical protein
VSVATTAYRFRSTDLPSTQASQPRSQTRPARSRSDAPDESSTVRAREVASGGVGGGEVVRTSYGSGSGRHAVAIVSVDAAVAFDVAFDVAVYGEMGGCESWGDVEMWRCGDVDGYTRPRGWAVAVAGTQWQLYRWMRQWRLMLHLMWQYMGRWGVVRVGEMRMDIPDRVSFTMHLRM